jgi:hypothetical protein
MNHPLRVFLCPSSADKTFIVNNQPTDANALDFTLYVETLADIAATGNTPLNISKFAGLIPWQKTKFYEKTI